MLTENSNLQKTYTSDLKIKPGDLSIFCYQLALILKSGIPLLEGMELLSDEMMNAKLKAASKKMFEDILDGLSLYESLEKHDIFPIYMVNMVKIAEVTGNLGDEMDRLSIYYEKMERLGRRIRNAITYPLILTGLMGCIILLLILKILPMFKEILTSVGGQMPEVTQTLLDISTSIQRYFLLVVIVILMLSSGLLFYFKTLKGRKLLDRLKLKLPIYKTVYGKIIASRFSISMSLLIKSGIEFDEALGMIRNTLDNTYVSEKIDECRKMIKNNGDAAQALQQIGIFPKLFVKMLNIGYKTGELDNMLSRVSDRYESEVDIALQGLTASIEPLLVVILSIIVGVILLTVMLPLINIMSSIG